MSFKFKSVVLFLKLICSLVLLRSYGTILLTLELFLIWGSSSNWVRDVNVWYHVTDELLPTEKRFTAANPQIMWGCPKSTCSHSLVELLCGHQPQPCAAERFVSLTEDAVMIELELTSGVFSHFARIKNTVAITICMFLLFWDGLDTLVTKLRSKSDY